MKISTKGRYALRLMLDLAIHGSKGPTSLKDTAKRQEISEKYLEQIIALLNKAGFVKSVRGAQGGYLLTRAPEGYTVGEILRGGKPGRMRAEGRLRDGAHMGKDFRGGERRGGRDHIGGYGQMAGTNPGNLILFLSGGL